MLKRLFSRFMAEEFSVNFYPPVTYRPYNTPWSALPRCRFSRAQLQFRISASWRWTTTVTSDWAAFSVRSKQNLHSAIHSASLLVVWLYLIDWKHNFSNSQWSNSQSTLLYIVICYLLLVVECYLDKFCALQFAFQPKRQNFSETILLAAACCWYGHVTIVVK